MSDDAKKKALAERVKQASSAGFGATCGFRHISFDEGKAIVELDIGPAVQNMGGFLHGGAIATMVDDAGTLAIITKIYFKLIPFPPFRKVLLASFNSFDDALAGITFLSKEHSITGDNDVACIAGH